MESRAWLRLVPLEMDDLEEKEFIDPKTPIGPDEVVLGHMSIDAKRLYTLSLRYAKAAAEASIQEKFGDSAETDEKRSHRLAGYANLLKEIMWAVIKDDLELWDKPVSLAVRKEFMVVSSPAKGPSFLELFRE